MLESPLIIIKLHLYISGVAVEIFRIGLWAPRNFHQYLRTSNKCFWAAVNRLFCNATVSQSSGKLHRLMEMCGNFNPATESQYSE